MKTVVIKDLATLRELYEPQGKSPAMLASVDNPGFTKGDVVVADDGRGTTVRCIVERSYIEVKPVWGTYNEAVRKEQGTLV